MSPELLVMLGAAMALMAAGLVAGFCSGLFGIGGGIIMVPALYMIFIGHGVDPQLAMHIAIGTSLFTVVPTSVKSLRAHEKHGAVDHTLLKQWALMLVLGSVLGAWLGQMLPGKTNTLIFGFFMLLITAYMGLCPPHIKALAHPPQGWGQKVGAAVVGFIAALVGVGGGVLAVPAMLLCNITMHRAVATSSGVGFLIALPAVLIQLGIPMLHAATITGAGLPSGTMGYVNLPAALFLIMGTLIMAPYGARLAHRLHAHRLRRYFALLLLVIAIKMIVAGLH